MAQSKAADLNIIFGTGPLGLTVMEELLSRGGRVRLVNRSGRANVPAGVEVVRGDASNPAQTRQICQDATVVYHCASPAYTEWPTKFPPLMKGIIEGAAAANARLVYGDNLYMYGPVAGPLKEDLPNRATGPKGRTRAHMAQMLMEADRSGKVRATIGRASNFYGPRVLESSIVGERVFKAALTGQTAEMLGNLDAPHTYTFIKDFARGLVTLGTREQAPGEIWHIPGADTLTTRQFLELIYREAGTTPKFRVAPRMIVTLMSLFNPMMRELKEVLYEYEKPFVVDHGKYTRKFGGETTPHSEAIRETLDWYRRSMK